MKSYIKYYIIFVSILVSCASSLTEHEKWAEKFVGNPDSIAVYLSDSNYVFIKIWSGIVVSERTRWQNVLNYIKDNDLELIKRKYRYYAGTQSISLYFDDTIKNSEIRILFTFEEDIKVNKWKLFSFNLYVNEKSKNK